ncbi:FAR1-RELATED SEQUENCE 11-like protein [Drosera capensis]
MRNAYKYRAFLGFMNGKAPKTILTDQDMRLKEAIAMEMPTSKHALCIRLIVAKFPSWFNAVLGERYTEWKAEFFRLYNMGSVEDFEYGWREMVSSCALHGNKHIANLFYLQSLWALPYLRSHFFAGLIATGQSKLINLFIQQFVSAQTRLPRFLEQLADAVEFKDQAGEQGANGITCFHYPYTLCIFEAVRTDGFGGSLCIISNERRLSCATSHSP